LKMHKHKLINEDKMVIYSMFLTWEIENG